MILINLGNIVNINQKNDIMIEHQDFMNFINN